MAERAVIVGAGPVGSMLACLLAERGYVVDVYERRPDMRRHAISAGRSINLAVSTRGLHGLHLLGLDEEVLRQAVPMHGRMIHALDGATQLQPYGKSGEFINSMSRGEINKMLMTRAEATGRVRIHFQHRLVEADLDARRATFKRETTGEGVTVDAPVLVGADGSASVLRAAILGKTAGVYTNDLLSSGYKELTIPPAAGPSRFAIEPNALHIWPRGHFMLIALPNQDGSFTVTLFLPYEGDPSFAGLKTPAEVDDFFARYFADAAALIPGLTEAFLAAPLGQMVTVRTAPWAWGKNLLIGDAARAIVPFFGQGMNAGFEDCTELARLLDASADVAAAFARFSETRKPNADAIADLAVENFTEMRDKVADPVFMLQRAVEAELTRRHPERYWTRYRLVTFSRTPYRVALEAGRIQAGLFDELVRGRTRVDEVDFARADELLEGRFFPFLREHGVIAH